MAPSELWRESLLIEIEGEATRGAEGDVGEEGEEDFLERDKVW